MSRNRTRIFPGAFSSLADIGAFVAGAAQAAGLNERAAYAIQMAVDEACSNIIEHAYRGQESGQIECSYEIKGDRLTIVLRDQGQCFDPTLAFEPDINTTLEDRMCGGLGVYFIRKLVDQVQHEYVPDSGNVLTLIMYREPSP